MRVHILHLRTAYLPQSELACTCVLDPLQHAIRAVESSILWTTEGKGDQDRGLHFFHLTSFDPHLSSSPQKIELPLRSRLPSSPLTYRGQILKIGWSISLRVMLTNESEFRFDFPFRLVGHADDL